MVLCKESVAAEQQSMNPDADSTSCAGTRGFGEEKSSRAMSKDTLMASRSAHMVLMSCLAQRTPRAILLVSVIIYKIED